MKKKNNNLNSMTIENLVSLFLDKEEETIKSLKKEKRNISKAIKEISKKIESNGRVIYIGAGTSGRLGVLDAVECKPTFNTDIFLGAIAGGEGAFFKAKEGSEDNEKLGIEDLKKLKVRRNDVVIGIAASGETPYTVSALQYANKLGALTIGISSKPKSSLSKIAKHQITPNIEREIISGSSRLSSGTSQKMILNMISSISMIKAGKVYKDLMIDVLPTNKKLVKRAISIISNVCNISFNKASVLFKKSNRNIRAAIVMHIKGYSLPLAMKALKENNFNLDKTIH